MADKSYVEQQDLKDNWDLLSKFIPGNPSLKDVETKIKSEKGFRIRTCNGCRKKTHEKLKMCSRCETTHYCSVECQRSDYSEHKLKCASLKGNGEKKKKITGLLKRLNMKIQIPMDVRCMFVIIHNTMAFIQLVENEFSSVLFSIDYQLKHADIYDYMTPILVEDMITLYIQCCEDANVDADVTGLVFMFSHATTLPVMFFCNDTSFIITTHSERLSF